MLVFHFLHSELGRFSEELQRLNTGVVATPINPNAKPNRRKACILSTLTEAAVVQGTGKPEQRVGLDDALVR